MERTEGSSQPAGQSSSQRQEETRGDFDSRFEQQSLPPVDVSQTNPTFHDLSYLEGPPVTVGSRPGEIKRYFEGISTNARLLGISKTDLLKSDAQSPFYSIRSATEDHSNLPVSLQPSVIQHRYPHHPFFDCIPIPAFRDKAILAAAASPPLVNRFELCYDMFAGGLTYSDDPTMEHSWIMNDVFQAKWAALLHFDLDELRRRVDQQQAS